jgi:AraC-like DNA-binding protein
MKTVLLSFILLSSCFAAAQTNDTQYQKDSLRQVIAVAQGEEKLKAYQVLTNMLFIETFGNSLKRDTLFALYDEMKEEAERQGEYKYAGFTLSNKIRVYDNSKMFDEAIAFAPECLEYFVRHDLWNYYYDTYRSLVKIHARYKGEYEKALEIAGKVYEEAKARKHKFGIAIALYAMSNTYSSMERYEDEERYMRQSIEILKELDIWTNVTSGYFYLCQSLLIQERYDEAKKELDEYEKAIHRAEEFLFVRDGSSWRNLWGIAASIYFESGDYEEAELYCKKLENENTGDSRVQIAILMVRASLFEERKEYDRALEQIEQWMELEAADRQSLKLLPVRMRKARVLTKMGRSDEAYDIYTGVFNAKDSTYHIELNARLDEIRTQYEVDKITAEKERNRNNFFFALAGCALLLVLLVSRMYYNRQIAGKNRALTQQIRELAAQQELREAELLNKTSFIDEDVQEEDGFCPESRKDKLCVAIRDLILRDKAYRNPLISRDYMIDRLNTSRELFVEAFMFCFGMSFTEYINSLRLKDAVILLGQSDLSIEDISKKTGFGTVRTFQRQFQMKYNMSPKDYRNSAKLS